MTCTSHEGALALHVEGDLPAAEVHGLEAHLEGCANCRGLLEGLRATQRAVRDLASEPLDEQVLDDLGARVASAHSAARRRPSTSQWILAAALAALVIAGAWLARSWLPSDRVARLPAAAPVHSAAPAAPQAVDPGGAPVHLLAPGIEPRSTIPSRSKASRRVRQPAQSPALSPEDADQLAQAALAMSRIRSVEEALRKPVSTDPGPGVVRLETAHPDVLIYWRLDSNGGE